MKEIIEKILLKYWFIKISKAKHISETFIKYMIEDTQKLIEEDFWQKKDPNYEKEFLKMFNNLFNSALTKDKIDYEIDKDRRMIMYWYND